MKQSSRQISLTQKAFSFWGIILIIWSFYRSKFRLPIEFDELLFKPLVFITPVIYFIKNIEKKPITKSLWIERKKLIYDIYLTFIALLFLSFFLLLIKKLGFIHLKINLAQNIQQIILINFFTATSENILSLGFVLKKLYEEKKNFINSLFLSATLYFILRIPALFTEPTLTGSMLIYTMITSFLLNLGLGILFLTRRSLWLPIFVHCLYLTSLQVILF